jgi:putative heme-binding domain-containing protein
VCTRDTISGVGLLWFLFLSPLLAQETGYTPAEVARGTALYRANCVTCHGWDGDQVAVANLRKPPFRRASTDAELARLIGTGVPGTAMPPSKLPDADLRALVAFIRSMHDLQTRVEASGDRLRGKALVEGKGGCLNCHRIGGNGRRLAPDLTDIGALRQAPRLERSILEPDEVILVPHRFVRAVSKDGTVFNGRRLNEDTHTLQLMDEQERLVSLAKDDLREWTVLPKSPMPSFRGKFTPQELSDLLNYLSSLKGLELK